MPRDYRYGKAAEIACCAKLNRDTVRGVDREVQASDQSSGAADTDEDLIQLAREPRFSLGALNVDPATRRVATPERRATLEPRVMQVLVALARANGAVVSRDELINCCWGGRIVGDNAVNRAISLVRGVGAKLGEGAFELETISRVGYRLVVSGSPVEDLSTAAWPRSLPPKATAPSAPRRRMMLTGAAATALAAAGAGAYLFARGRHSPDPAALALYRKGLDAQRQGLPDQTVQAISFLQEAVRIDPDYADAWGGLALSYRHRLETDSAVDQAAIASWIVAAADHALRLDPANADGQVAKIIIRPAFGNWTALDAAYRAALKRHPDHWLLRGTFGRLMYGVGRWRDGLPAFRANIAADPFLPMSRCFLAYGLWHSGGWQEAESTIESAFARWPTHPAIWLLRFRFLSHTGRTAAAIAFASNVEGRPVGLPDGRFVDLVTTARALGSGASRDVSAAVDAALAAARRGPDAIPDTVEVLAALGEPGAAFELLESYFLGKAVATTPAARIGPLTRRETDFLFTQATMALRADTRFGYLAERIGLEAYWTATGSPPDYRRPASIA